MKPMAGWMMPEMNCALNDALYSSAFWSWNSETACSCRPNTFTSAWPVYISSMWEFSVPVTFHCCTNCGCERLAIAMVTTNDSGTVTSATTASSGEIQNIMPSTPRTVSTEVMSCESVCCRVWATLSMSLVTRLSTSPRGCPSKYFSGSRPSLASTCSRSPRTVRCTAPVVTYPWIQPNSAEAT